MNKHRHQPIVFRKHQEQDGCAEVEEEDGDDAAASEHLGDLYAESGQTLQGSFSAVSKPNFASKYSFESS